mmetsp:Transcript_23723/g.59935  ORF Transcript_23723/g.59935 Transcript_23723/m.59935 type:complete len:286 (+) Transcript_23723:945-1802(+)
MGAHAQFLGLALHGGDAVKGVVGVAVDPERTLEKRDLLGVNKFSRELLRVLLRIHLAQLRQEIQREGILQVHSEEAQDAAVLQVRQHLDFFREGFHVRRPFRDLFQRKKPPVVHAFDVHVGKRVGSRGGLVETSPGYGLGELLVEAGPPCCLVCSNRRVDHRCLLLAQLAKPLRVAQHFGGRHVVCDHSFRRPVCRSSARLVERGLVARFYLGLPQIPFSQHLVASPNAAKHPREVGRHQKLKLATLVLDCNPRDASIQVREILVFQPHAEQSARVHVARAGGLT